jgi:hypothetical protein
MSEFQTNRNDLTKTRIIKTDINHARENLNQGQILVQVDRFAFTANNVTYGAAGDTIGYWKFFPAREDAQNDWGCLPVWGFATIVGSILDGLIEGERVYGYFPPADFLVMRPIKLTSGRFVDGSIHRAELPAVYNNYVRLDNESGYDQSVDNIRALLNPLHITSFCLCDALKSETFYGAEQIIVLSASSKTAIGMAQGLLDSGVSPEILGITSRSNYDFVRSLGCYSHVCCYDELDTLDSIKPSVIIDMSGNRAVLGAIHELLGSRMLNCINVGMTHWDTLANNDPVGAKINRDRSNFFFAPAHVQKRIGDWGHDVFNQRATEFMIRRMRQSTNWMRITEVNGFDSFVGIYDAIVAGDMNPEEGVIVVMPHVQKDAS